MNILVTGALGQIGSALVQHMRGIYGSNNIIASDLNSDGNQEVIHSGPFEKIDVTDGKKIAETVKSYNIDTVIHLASILSAVGEHKPNLAWDINMNGLFNVLEVARYNRCAVFVPSSIAAFGPQTPKDHTPQDTLQRPTTMYGVTKVSGEILCDYYYKKYKVDARGLRFPGLISHESQPGGGTTDYAVHIFYEALKNKGYNCYLREDTYMDMMYMPDAVDAIVKLMEANPERLIHRNAFNVTAMSFNPKQIANEIKKHIPEFEIQYEVDLIRQDIADSWPNSLDDSAAREQWDWSPKYDLASMTEDMLKHIRQKI
ncbi:L-threonine 3-dehydrogenase [Serpentinicella sp. ANB-PHB4]|uniref:L-threonine 3-dehydrogenase n=1 Tax=Serpentinicella sp. ANB-PHB4 TaxID=3074076 RepID=UPI002857BF5F|nr:L-threonine 3-dehydrogenase [Serpentinicella sp. ANB-PHB4]MDR5658737.1 L-threonine 3-dehydrogenase [Serpentinicella sp. ANB-PHB4]